MLKSLHLDHTSICGQQENIQKEVWFVVVRLIEPTHCCMPNMHSLSDQDLNHGFKISV